MSASYACLLILTVWYSVWPSRHGRSLSLLYERLHDVPLVVKTQATLPSTGIVPSCVWASGRGVKLRLPAGPAVQCPIWASLHMIYMPPNQSIYVRDACFVPLYLLEQVYIVWARPGET